MAERFTTFANLDKTIQDITKEYRDKVLRGIGDGVQEGAEIYVKEVKKISPPDDGPGIGGHYRDSWVIKPMKKAKFVKYVGNKKKVKGKDDSGSPKMIPLINILEFSKTYRARPHVGKAISNSEGQILQAIISKIQKESNNA